MKKLSKTMKSIIISGVSLICVAAIVLGCVFGLKKNPNDGGNGGNNGGGGNPPTPAAPVYSLTEAQLALGNAVNASSQKNSFVEFSAVNVDGVALRENQLLKESEIGISAKSSTRFYLSGSGEYVNLSTALGKTVSFVNVSGNYASYTYNTSEVVLDQTVSYRKGL